jgi:hypothetical protein
MSACSCPAGTAIASVPNASCPQDFGQIQKIIFQRIFSTGTTKNSMTEANAKLLATWTALFSATAGTKMVITPYVEAPAADGGDAITFGGGNDTVGGVTKVIGRNPVNMTFALRQIDQSIAKALKALMCENVGVYLINGDGQIMGISDHATTPKFFPIPITSLFVGDLRLNGLDTPDENALSFSFQPNWSDDAVVITPTDFNPLTDLANASQ